MYPAAQDPSPVRDETATGGAALAEGFFAPGGRLAALLGQRFEARPGQQAMAGAVAEGLVRGGIHLFEAGTGTGKSLAYLVPLLEHLAAKPQSRAVVATYTHPLQQQLLEHDLPVALAATEARVEAALVKGWSNYLCRLRLARLTARRRDRWLWPDEAAGAADSGVWRQLQTWAETGTDTGDRAELPPGIPGAAWEAVAADPDGCTRRRCPFYDACFFFAARRRVQRARLLVANHHLLLADHTLRREVPGGEAAVLPEYDYLVVDEAHHLDGVAFDHFTTELAAHSLHRRLERLRTARRFGALRGPARQALAALQGFFATLAEGAHRLGRPASEAAGTVWVELGPVAHAAGPALERYGNDAASALEQLAQHAAQAAASEAVPGGADDEAVAHRVAEWQRIARWGERTAAALEFMLEVAGAGATDGESGDEPGDYVAWVEARPAGQADRPGEEVTLKAAPVEVGGILANEVLQLPRVTILTSATLRAAGSFQALRRRLGLAGDDTVDDPGAPGVADGLPEAEPDASDNGVIWVRPRSPSAGTGDPGAFWPAPPQLRQGVWEMVVPSPFALERQALVAVPVDLPAVDAPEFVAALSDLAARLAAELGGRTLVLFTSHRMLQESARRLVVDPVLVRAGVQCLVQGQASRGQLLDTFRAADGLGFVLLGTDSFWEGIDLPGATLSCIVMARLPFPVPDHPLTRAQARRWQRLGRNPFWEEALPRGVLKFRQGFGRLIRTARDRGALVVADHRLVRRSYGRWFARAVEPSPMMVGPATRLVAEVVAWIGLAKR